MKKLIALLLVLVMVFSLVACGAKEEAPAEKPAETPAEKPAETPAEEPAEAPADVPESWLCNEKTTLKVLTYDGVNSNFLPPSNDLRFWQWMEEYTNVHIEWEILSYTGYNDVISARLAGGDELADIVMLNSDSIARDAGANGIVVDLSQYWDTCFTNMQTLFDGMGIAYKNCITNADGTCYGITTVANPDNNRVTFLYNTLWLEELGAEVPTTLEEFTALLEQMKAAGDLNGNGEADEIILTAAEVDHIRSSLNPSFNMEHYGSEDAFSADDSGLVSCMWIGEEMKAELGYLNELYEAGLLDPEICTNDYEILAAKVAADRVGVFCCYSSFAINDGRLTTAGQADPLGEWYTVGGPLGSEYNNYKPVLTLYESYGSMHTGIASSCENVELAAKWLDTLYADPTVLQTRTMGFEGETYEVVDGKAQPIMPADGSSWSINTLGCGQLALPYVQTTEQVTFGFGNMPWYLEQTNNLINNYPWQDHSVTKVVGYTDEEIDYRMFRSDVKTGWAEHRDKFIQGQLDIEADWDSFVSTLEALGLNDLTACYQSIYDRTK